VGWRRASPLTGPVGWRGASPLTGGPAQPRPGHRLELAGRQIGMEARARATERFVRGLRRLMNEFFGGSDDAEVAHFMKLANLALEDAPGEVVDRIGPVVLEHAAEIAAAQGGDTIPQIVEAAAWAMAAVDRGTPKERETQELAALVIAESRARWPEFSPADRARFSGIGRTLSESYSVISSPAA